MSKQTARIRRERMAAGLCRECADPKAPHSRAYCEQCLEKTRKAQSVKNAMNRSLGLCACGGTPNTSLKRCQTCADSYRRRARRWKLQVIAGYGGKCGCCGETQFEFLSIDHVQGGGSQERKKFGWRVKAVALCRKIVKEGFPPAYRILCHNCNQALGAFGYCPHQVKKIA